MISYCQDYNDNNKYIKIIFSLYDDVQNEIVLMQNNKYKIVSAIFYHGFNPRLGHYTTMLRHEDSWLDADDSWITPKSWFDKSADNADVYVIFLQEVADEETVTPIIFPYIDENNRIIPSYINEPSQFNDLLCDSMKRKNEPSETYNFSRDDGCHHQNKKQKTSLEQELYTGVSSNYSSLKTSCEDNYESKSTNKNLTRRDQNYTIQRTKNNSSFESHFLQEKKKKTLIYFLIN